jgi:hypothetical protein
VFALLLSLFTPGQAQAQQDPGTGVGKLEALRLPGLPGALRGRLDLEAKAWPQVANLLLETTDLKKLGTLTTTAAATLDLPEAGQHSFVEVFAASTKQFPSAKTYAVTVKVTDEGGGLLGATTVTVDPTQPPPVLALTYHKDVKAKVKIEVVASGAKGRVVVTLADEAYGLAHGVNVEVVGLDEAGKPSGGAKALTLPQQRSFVRLQAPAQAADPIIAAAGLWQQTIPTVWSLDSNSDGKPELLGEASLELDIRDVKLASGELLVSPEGTVALDLALQASKPQYLSRGLEVFIWSEKAETPAYLWVAPQTLGPQFLVELPFSADPEGTPVEFSVQLFNQDGKPLGAPEACTLTVADKARCKTPSGLLLRVGGWGGGSWAGSGSSTVSGSLQLRVQAPSQPNFEPALWPHKIAVTAIAKSDKLKATGPSKTLGQKVASWNAYDGTPQEGQATLAGPNPGPFTLEIRIPKGPETPAVGASFKVSGFGEVLIDGPKFEVE